jgi:hypothetical protein
MTATTTQETRQLIARWRADLADPQLHRHAARRPPVRPGQQDPHSGITDRPRGTNRPSRSRSDRGHPAGVHPYRSRERRT